jgi:hypothetical protein
MFTQLNGCIYQCNHTPLCSYRHRAKQAERGRLERPEPGVLRWKTPAGRIYTTTPTAYLI